MEVATAGANNPRLLGPGVQIQSIKRLHEAVGEKAAAGGASDRPSRGTREGGSLYGGGAEGGGRWRCSSPALLNFPRPA